jgi:hypothetical protein
VNYSENSGSGIDCGLVAVDYSENGVSGIVELQTSGSETTDKIAVAE